MSNITVHRASDRFLTDIGWLHSRHSFNFGPHYAPEHQGHGLLVVNNDDVVAPGQGFGTHGHRDMEIVTWVLSGRLEHRDSEGNHGVLYPGLAQRMSAGAGIRHSEFNASADEPVHFLQMWVLPDTPGIAPGYEQLDLNDALAAGGLVPAGQRAGPRGRHPHPPARRRAVGRPSRRRRNRAPSPKAAHVHVFVATGSGELDGAGALSTGDAARLTRAGTPGFTAGPEGAELSVWATE
jgi:redox-sensitive bicupin YhaK (pirin superfamily)